MNHTLSIMIHCHRDSEIKYQQILAATVNEKITIMDAASKAGVSPKNIHRMIKKLQSAGCVKKTFGGKYRYLSITKTGIDALEKHGRSI